MTAGATASDSPFIKGRNARLNGKSRDSCPYPEGSEDGVAWLQAWDEAGVNDEGGESAEKDRGTVDGL